MTGLSWMGNQLRLVFLQWLFVKARMPLNGQPIEVTPWGKNKRHQAKWVLRFHINGTTPQKSHIFFSPKFSTRSVFHMITTNLLKQIKTHGTTFSWSLCTIKFPKPNIIVVKQRCIILYDKNVIAISHKDRLVSGLFSSTFQTENNSG